MKTARILAILVVASAIIPGIGTTIAFGEEGPFRIAHPYDIISAPAAGGERILWIKSTPLSFPDPGYYPWVPCAVYSYNITSRTKTLIRSRATNARSPDIDGDLAVWEEERKSTTDIIFYNFSAGTVSALHTNRFQHNPRVSEYCIVWEEGFVGERGIRMYNTNDGNLRDLSTGKVDCFAPDIEGNIVVWVEKNDQDAYSIVSRDLISGRLLVLATTSTPVCPRIDGGRVIWENEGLIHLASNKEDMSIITSEPACRSGAIISDTIVAWSEDGRIFCSDLLEMQTIRIGKQHTSTKPAITNGGISWVEDDHCAPPYIWYQPFSPLPEADLQVVPYATIMPPTRGDQSGLLQEGECTWYVLDVSTGTNRIYLDFSWEEVEESLSCTLICPGGTILRFTDDDDDVMDARVKIAVTSRAGIVPGRWYCAISGESIQKEASYSIIWYEYRVPGK